MSPPASTGIPSTGHPVGPSNASATKERRSSWTTKSTWGVDPKWRDFKNNPSVRVWDHSVPADDEEYWTGGVSRTGIGPEYVELPYVPCGDVLSHFKPGMARMDHRGIGLPTKCGDPDCKYRARWAFLQAKSLIRSFQELIMHNCGETGGLRRPPHLHECLWQTVLVEWGTGADETIRNTMRKRIDRRGEWGFVIQTKQTFWATKSELVEQELTRGDLVPPGLRTKDSRGIQSYRTITFSLVPVGESGWKRSGEDEMVPIEAMLVGGTRFWLSERGQARLSWTQVYRLLGRAIRHRAPNTRLRLIGLDVAQGQGDLVGIGAADPSPWVCPHPDHVEVVPPRRTWPSQWSYQPNNFHDPLVNGSTPIQQWYSPVRDRLRGFDGLKPTYLLTRRDEEDEKAYCLLHGLEAHNPNDSVGSVTEKTPLEDRLKGAGYEPTGPAYINEDYEQVDLKLRPEDVQRISQMVQRYHQRIEETCQEWTERVDEPMRSSADLELLRLQDESENLWIDWLNVKQMEENRTYLRTILTDASYEHATEVKQTESF